METTPIARRVGCLLLAVLLSLGLCGTAAGSGEVIAIVLDAANQSHRIQDSFYGLFYEDINQAGDGGLYPELVTNRSFEARTVAAGTPTPFSGWYFNTGNKGQGEYTAAYDDPLYDSNPTYVRVTVDKSPYWITNNGYSSNSNPDMYITAGAEFTLSLYLRAAAENPYTGAIVCELTDPKGNAMSSSETVSFDGTWQKYSMTLTAHTEGKARLVLRCEDTGRFEMDFVSLMPADTWGGDAWLYGGLRKDLVEALQALNPGFIRFPGGCIVEGAYRHETHYNWKDTIGLPEQRRENVNLWGYMMSYGLGYHEYFQLCEDLDAEPVPVLHAGLLCQARNNGSNTEPDWKPGDPEFDGLIQDYLDLIEYANGGADTTWGAKRAENGHPEPFGLKMIGIGNENWGEEYWVNFKAIREAILAVYPEMDIITTTGPLAEGWINNLAWSHINAEYTDVIADEHYYMSPEWFLTNTKRYDAYVRNGSRIFVGEYAAHENVEGDRRPNTLYSALCEAAYMTGLERNADIIVMTSYAPLFSRAGMFQWSPDMIWFNSKEITNLTPNYWTQHLFANHTGTAVIKPAQPIDTKQLFQASSADADTSTLYTKLVNPYDTEKTVTIQYKGYDNLSPTAVLSTLSGAKTAKDSTPVSGEASLSGDELTLTLAPYSLTAVTVAYDVPDAEVPQNTESPTENTPAPTNGSEGDSDNEGDSQDDKPRSRVNLWWIALPLLAIGAGIALVAVKRKR